MWCCWGSRVCPKLNPSFWELKALSHKAPLKHFLLLLQTTPVLATTFTALALLETQLGWDSCGLCRLGGAQPLQQLVDIPTSQFKNLPPFCPLLLPQATTNSCPLVWLLAGGWCPMHSALPSQLGPKPRGGNQGNVATF